MKKNIIKYGVAQIPIGIAICSLEKGGDKKNKARYRFSDTGKRTTKKTIKLITDEIIVTDLYNAPWIKIKEGWVKAENRITWYDNYAEATQALSKKKHGRKYLIYLVPILILTVLAIRYFYGKYKASSITTATAPAAEPIIETTQTVIPDEIPMD